MDFSKEAVEAANIINDFVEAGMNIAGMAKIHGIAIPESMISVIDFARSKSSLSHDECLEQLQKLFPGNTSEVYEAYYFYNVLMPEKQKFENIRQSDLESLMNDFHQHVVQTLKAENERRAQLFASLTTEERYEYDWFNSHIMEAKAVFPAEKFACYFNKYYAPVYRLEPIEPPKEES